MSGRIEAPVAKITAGRFAWVAAIPWLPDLLGNPSGLTLTGNPIREAFGRQISFLRAITAGAPRGTSLQLRFLATPALGTIECHVVGAGPNEEDVRALNQIVLTALPPEYPLEPIPREAVSKVLRAVDTDRFSERHVAEIRRAIDGLDPSMEDSSSDDPVLFPWVWSPQALLDSLGQLRLQRAETVLIVHLEPTDFAPEIAIFLQDEVRRLLEDLRSGEENPLAAAVLQAYRRWLRLLPKGCAKLRLTIASSAPLSPGLAESLSTDLTRSFEVGTDSWFGTAAVVTPSGPMALDACAAMIDECRSVAWGDSSHRDLARLAYLFDPLEANTAFRFPISPSGGLPGVASQRISSISRSRSHRNENALASIPLGSTSSGERVQLSAEDLNRHVLVAGLPGFGKSSTVQLLLSRAFLDLHVPFLVLDPSKSDYRPLISWLAAEGHSVRTVRLTPHMPAFNPLAIPTGVDRYAYAGRVIAAFDSAFSLSEQWPLAHLEMVRAVHRLYEQADNRQPTMRDLYRELGASIRRSAFTGEARSNLEGSLLGRIEYLVSGPTGRALLGGATASIDWVDVLSRPTVIEMGGFAGPSERSLMFGLLIAGLVSHVEAHPGASGLRHVTVLEEAHRVLRPGGRDSGVEVFVDAIAELRSAGEGFVVVDQAPSSLHPGVSKLTSTKIIHRVVEEDERRSLGAAMVLDDHQIDDVARLGTRRAVVYSATATEAALIDVDDLRIPASSPVAVASSLVADPRADPVHCVRCPHMCEGSGGLGRLNDLLVDAELDWTDPRAVLRRSFNLLGGTGSRDLRRKSAYCLSAAGLSASAEMGRVARGSAPLHSLLHAYDVLLSEERKATAKNG